MAAKKKTAAKTAATTTGGFWADIGAVLKSPTAKQIATWLLTLIAGAGAAGFAVHHAVSAKIDSLTPGKIGPRIRKLFEPKDAIVRINMGNSMCSATVIGPVNDDDEYLDMLTAAHCVKVGQTGTVTMADGRKLPFRCLSRAETADVAWIRTARPDGIIPNLLLADVAPPPGSHVWHQGYGIDQPRNREDGVVVGVRGDNSRVTYRLSVSPGDSGGGIILTDDDRVISPVCCTTKLSGMGTVWGGTPFWCHKIRPAKHALSEEGNPVNPIMTYDSTSIYSTPVVTSPPVESCPNGVCIRPIYRRW